MERVVNKVASTTVSNGERASASQRLMIRRIYRNLLETVKPYTSPSPNARVLNCLLHRTGIDDHIGDWESFVSSDPYDPGADEQARDLTLSLYGGIETSYDNEEIHNFYSTTSRDAVPPNRTYQRLFRRLLREVVSGTPYGIRKSNFPSQIVDVNKLRDVVRREFRGGPESQSFYFDEATRRQVAFTTIRELNKKLSYFDELRSNAPEPRQDQAACHVSSLPFSPPTSYLRPGAFLLSHPTMNDSYFGRSVICILEHNDETILDSSASKRNQTPGQTYGIIVNRICQNPDSETNRSLTEAFEQHMLPGKLADIFGDSIVREGGPVHVAMKMLYGIPGFKDTSKIMTDLGGNLIPTIPQPDTSPSLFSDQAIYSLDDVFKAIEAVDAGKLDPDNIAFFVGGSTWAPGQLEHEMAQGFWMPCRGPSDIALTGICEHQSSSTFSPTSSSSSSSSTSSSKLGGQKRPLADLWLSMLCACGEEEGKLAHLFYDDIDSDNGQPCDALDDNDIDFL